MDLGSPIVGNPTLLRNEVKEQLYAKRIELKRLG
jgi:hypothetical protein